MEQNEILVKQYMVEFEVPQPLSDELLSLIPDQRAAIDQLFMAGKMLSYSYSAERSKVWSLVLAENESELIQIIDRLPLTYLMDFDYSELMFHNSVHLVPSMSLN